MLPSRRLSWSGRLTTIGRHLPGGGSPAVTRQVCPPQTLPTSSCSSAQKRDGWGIDVAEPTGLFLLKHMIIGRAAADAEYRRALLADPERMLSAAQLQRDLGHTPPPGRTLRVVEETDKRLYLVIPKKNAKLIVQAEMANDPVLQLIAWAMNNPRGKAALKRDVRAFIRERIGVDLGDQVHIQVLEDTEDVEYVVLPRDLGYIAGDYYLAQHGALLAAGQAAAEASEGEGWGGGGGGGGWGGGGGTPPTVGECVGCRPNTVNDTVDDCDDGVFTPGDEDCKCWSACAEGSPLTWDTADMPTDPAPG